MTEHEPECPVVTANSTPCMCRALRQAELRGYQRAIAEGVSREMDIIKRLDSEH